MVEVEIRKNESELIQYKKAEFQVGDIYGNGSARTYKNQDYEEYKYFKNPDAGGQVDLMNTGDFIRSFFLQKPLKNKYLFGAKDWKSNLLKENYGIEIYGMNQDKFNRFLDFYVVDDFRKELKKIING